MKDTFDSSGEKFAITHPEEVEVFSTEIKAAVNSWHIIGHEFTAAFSYNRKLYF